jgi:hypothetical protein
MNFSAMSTSLALSLSLLSSGSSHAAVGFGVQSLGLPIVAGIMKVIGGIGVGGGAVVAVGGTQAKRGDVAFGALPVVITGTGIIAALGGGVILDQEDAATFFKPVTDEEALVIGLTDEEKEFYNKAIPIFAVIFQDILAYAKENPEALMFETIKNIIDSDNTDPILSSAMRKMYTFMRNHATLPDILKD